MAQPLQQYSPEAALPTPATAEKTEFTYPRIAEQIRTIAEALFSDENGPPPADRIEWLLAAMDEFMEHAGPGRRGFQLAVKAVHVLAPIVARRPRSLAKMSIAERVSALSLLEASAVGGPLTGAKLVMCTVYYEHPDAAAAIGCDAHDLSADSVPGVA